MSGTDYVFYPVTGDGLTPGTAYTWNTGTINFDTGANWASVPSFETLTIGGTVTSGTVPPAGSNIGLIAGAIDPNAFAFYTPNPGLGDPYIGSSSFPVDVLINSGTVTLDSVVMSGFNTYTNVIGGHATAQFPTLDVEGATLTITGSVLASASVTFPPIVIPPIPFILPHGTTITHASATGGGTFDLGNSATVVVDGAVSQGVTFHFNDANNNELEVLSASKSTPGGFAGTITGMVPGDTLLLPNIPAEAGGTPTTANYDVITGVLTITVGDPVQIMLNVPGFSDVSGPVPISPSGTGIEVVACFLPGTRIRTPCGEVAVEALSEGDLVCTADGGAQKVAWIGTGKALATRGRRDAATPIVVRKGALADNVPNRDLRITKGHALFLDGVLVPAEFLVNHRSILWDDRAQEVTVHHVELATHAVLIANGAPAESYRDDGNRWLFRNANAGWHLPPKEPYAPVLTGGPVVDALWRRLLDRAGPRPGQPTTPDPDLHLVVDGHRVDAASRAGNRCLFRLTCRPTAVRIVSRVGVPQELGIARDPRALGVAVRAVAAWRGARVARLGAEDAALCDGYHAYETDNGFRWSDGDAAIPSWLFADFDGAPELEVHIGGTTTYPLEGEAARKAV